LKRSIGVDVRIRSLVIVSALGCAALSASACGSTSETTAAPAPASTTAPAAPVPLAADELAIDEVAVYDHVLTPERIKLHHDVGRGLTP